MKKGIVTLIAVAGLATVATAQTAGMLTFVVGNVVEPGNATTTVEIWAAWAEPAPAPPWLYLFAAANFDLNASEAGWEPGATANNAQLSGPNNVGTISGSSYVGASIGQIHIPQLGQAFMGTEGNPMLLATYEWTATEFTARNVSLDTSNTNNFILALVATGATTQLFPANFTAGAGSITVIPAPSALALLGLGGLVALRRRR